MPERGKGTRIQAVLFDLDGVLTATARVHEAAWKETFDAFLQRWAAQTGTSFRPFTPDDYARFVDGRLREDGVRTFLRSRQISLPEGSREPAEDEDSVRGLAERKNRRVEGFIRPDTIEVFPGSVSVVRSARERGLKTAVVSASANCRAVLAAGGISDLFDTVVDGTTIAELNLRGKPAPDSFLEAARQLDVAPEAAVVVEDAVAGVRAGREGGFGLVVGVDRRGNAGALRQAGAQLVVSDLWVMLGLLPGHHGPKLHRLLGTAQNVATAEDVIAQEPWRLVVRRPAPELAPQLESMLALSNGYLGIRGSVEEGAPTFRPATLLNGFHETWPIAHPEDAHGFARTGQTIVNLPDGLRIRLFADDKQLNPARHELASYERTLHLDRGVLERSLVWCLPDGSRIAVHSLRLVSFVNRHLACVVYEVEALDRPVAITLCSEFAEPRHHEAVDEAMDPRRRPLPSSALQLDAREVTADGVVSTLTTRQSGLSLACGMAHKVLGVECEQSVREDQDILRYVITTHLQPGRRLRLEKYLAYHYSARRLSGELSFRVQQTLEQARREGADAIIDQQERTVSEFWRDGDVELIGSPDLQFAVRYSIFQLFQASARAEGHGVPAKGLTGEGYEGHYFWDTEIYVLPFLVYTRPRLARELLMHRYAMLEQARQRAREVGLKGALFPWRTINGLEASASYASGTAQYHLNADIAFALRKYVEMSGDTAFLREYGAEILVETARLWADIGFFSARRKGKFVINGVTGPDEYTTVVDNNAFTNLMARENLQIALEALQTLRQEYPEDYDRLVTCTRLTPSEPELWRRAADAMYVPYDREAQVHLQDDAFLDQEPWDFASVPPDQYPLLLHFHPLHIYRHQVIKQADVMLAAFLLGNEFTDDEKRRIFEYYDPLTTGDSSLSECIQSIVACEVGEVAVAHRYLTDSATADLEDLHKNVRDGMHVASCGGTWMAMVYGFAGLRDYRGALSFRPSLPPHWQKLRFRLRVRGTWLEVELTQREATYRLLEGTSLELRHRGEHITLQAGEERRVRDPQMAPEVWSKSTTVGVAGEFSFGRRATN